MDCDCDWESFDSAVGEKSEVSRKTVEEGGAVSQQGDGSRSEAGTGAETAGVDGGVGKYHYQGLHCHGFHLQCQLPH